MSGFKNRFKYDIWKYGFTNPVANIWNSLPNYVVTANTTNVFMNISSGRIKRLFMRLKHS